MCLVMLAPSSLKFNNATILYAQRNRIFPLVLSMDDGSARSLRTSVDIFARAQKYRLCPRIHRTAADLVRQLWTCPTRPRHIVNFCGVPGILPYVGAFMQVDK